MVKKTSLIKKVSFVLLVSTMLIPTVLTDASSNKNAVLEAHNNLMLYGSNAPKKAVYDFRDTTDIVRNAKVYSKWIASKDYKNFHKAWEKLTSKEKSDIAMKKVKKEYQSAKAYLLVTASVYNYNDAVLKYGRTIYNNKALLDELSNQQTGLRKMVIDSLHEYTKIAAEPIEKGNRHEFIQGKYDAVVILLDGELALQKGIVNLNSSKSLEEIKTALPMFRAAQQKYNQLEGNEEFDELRNRLGFDIEEASYIYENVYSEIWFDLIEYQNIDDDFTFIYKLNSPVNPELVKITTEKDKTTVPIKKITYDQDNKGIKVEFDTSFSSGIYTFKIKIDNDYQEYTFKLL